MERTSSHVIVNICVSASTNGHSKHRNLNCWKKEGKAKKNKQFSRVCFFFREAQKCNTISHHVVVLCWWFCFKSTLNNWQSFK